MLALRHVPRHLTAETRRSRVQQSRNSFELISTGALVVWSIDVVLPKSEFIRLAEKEKKSNV